jgi:hypothetical protein
MPLPKLHKDAALSRLSLACLSLPFSSASVILTIVEGIFCVVMEMAMKSLTFIFLKSRTPQAIGRISSYFQLQCWEEL